MEINISTKYDIGDVLFLQQGKGGLRKVQVVEIVISGKYQSIIYILNKRVEITNPFITCLGSRVSEKAIIDNIKYYRRGNNWVIPMPKKVRTLGTMYKGNNNE